MGTELTSRLVARLQRLAGDVHHNDYWANELKTGAQTSGMEMTAEDPASRAWLEAKPQGRL